MKSLNSGLCIIDLRADVIIGPEVDPDCAGPAMLVSYSHNLLSSVEKQYHFMLIYNPEPNDLHLYQQQAADRTLSRFHRNTPDEKAQGLWETYEVSTMQFLQFKRCNRKEVKTEDYCFFFFVQSVHESQHFEYRVESFEI